MQSSAFKRSAVRLKSAYKLVDSALVAMEPLRVHIPERFAERDLASIEDVSYILGFMAVITEDNYYASSTITAMIRTEPDRVGRCVVDDVGYIELHYDKGSRFVANTNLVMLDNLVHRVYTELYGMGRIPWYYNYEDFPKFFADTGKYNGVTPAADLAVWEYMAAQLCRDPDDPTKYYRQRKDAKQAYLTHPPQITSLRNVALGATNVTARLAGSYFDDGLTASLVNPSDRAERIETMLRQ